MSDSTANDRRIIVHQLYAACALILGGAALGLAGIKLADATVGATLGTAVIGAGAALLPSGAAAGAAARAFPGSLPPAPVAVPVTVPAGGGTAAPVDTAALLADEEPDYGGHDGNGNGNGTLVIGTGRSVDGDV
jgi:hypothetical protein